MRARSSSEGGRDPRRSLRTRLGGRSIPARRRSGGSNCGELISAGRLSVKTSAAEDLVLDEGEQLYDVAFAVRVGAFDGRHPKRYEEAVRRVGAALVPEGRLFINGSDPLRTLMLPTQD